MAKILVTGSKGQLGSELQALHVNYAEHTFFFTCKDDLDITNKEAIETFCQTNQIDTIINCAAYTAVDKAESEVELANKINHQAVKYLAEIAKENSIKLIHISTDYVFDGNKAMAYTEDDIPNPLSIYGQSNYKAEQEMLNYKLKNSIIIRTSWLYSFYGNNFLKKMLKLGKERRELNVVCDQIGTPTYAKDLAKTILDILPQISNKKVEIYHYSNEGVLSWYDFAKEIMEMSKSACKIYPIETYQYPTPVIRPYFSVLNKSKIKKTFNMKIPYWKDSLDDCLKRLGERK